MESNKQGVVMLGRWNTEKGFVSYFNFPCLPASLLGVMLMGLGCGKVCWGIHVWDQEWRVVVICYYLQSKFSIARFSALNLKELVGIFRATLR